MGLRPETSEKCIFHFLFSILESSNALKIANNILVDDSVFINLIFRGGTTE